MGPRSCVGLVETFFFHISVPPPLRINEEAGKKGTGHFSGSISAFGLRVQVLSSLQPILIFEGDCECEVLVVKIKMENCSIRIIAGYGPQECAPVVVREKYRTTIEEQVIRTYLAGHMVLVAEDSNAKLGPDVIPGDPNIMSENGKLLLGMISRQALAHY